MCAVCTALWTVDCAYDHVLNPQKSYILEFLFILYTRYYNYDIGAMVGQGCGLGLGSGGP